MPRVELRAYDRAVVRVVTVVLVLGIASGPARADFDTGSFARRVQSRHRTSLILAGVGGAFLAMGVAGLAVIASSGTCGQDEFGFCRASYYISGGTLAAAGIGVAVPLLTSGFSLLHLSNSDRRDLAEQHSGDAWTDHASQRFRLGRTLTIAGIVVTALAVALGVVAIADVEGHWENSALLTTTGTLGAATGIVGLGLTSGGVTLMVVGNHDRHLIGTR